MQAAPLGAGTIAAIGNNTKGVIGVVGNANPSGIRLEIGKGLKDSGSGSTGNLIKQVENCVDNGANIISMSLGGGGFSTAFNDALQVAYMNEDVLIVAAGEHVTFQQVF